MQLRIVFHSPTFRSFLKGVQLRIFRRNVTIFTHAACIWKITMELLQKSNDCSNFRKCNICSLGHVIDKLTSKQESRIPSNGLFPFQKTKGILYC